jgi:hypothetical protein
LRVSGLVQCKHGSIYYVKTGVMHMLQVNDKSSLKVTSKGG